MFAPYINPLKQQQQQQQTAKIQKKQGIATLSLHDKINIVSEQAVTIKWEVSKARKLIYLFLLQILINSVLPEL